MKDFFVFATIFISIYLGWYLGQRAANKKVKTITKVNDITPFQIGQEVWFIMENKYCKARIVFWEVRWDNIINYTIDKNPIRESYRTRFICDELFPSLDELKNNIKIN